MENKKTLQIGDEVYWVYNGDVVKGKIIKFDEFNVKIETPDGFIFGKVGFYDTTLYQIWYDQIAHTREEAIKIVLHQMDLARITLNSWKDTLDDLRRSDL